MAQWGKELQRLKCHQLLLVDGQPLDMSQPDPAAGHLNGRAAHVVGREHPVAQRTGREGGAGLGGGTI
jgi:hypothetical protein